MKKIIFQKKIKLGEKYKNRSLSESSSSKHKHRLSVDRNSYLDKIATQNDKDDQKNVKKRKEKKISFHNNSDK